MTAGHANGPDRRRCAERQIYVLVAQACGSTRPSDEVKFDLNRAMKEVFQRQAPAASESPRAARTACPSIGA